LQSSRDNLENAYQAYLSCLSLDYSFVGKNGVLDIEHYSLSIGYANIIPEFGNQWALLAA
jgi:hypothetical protein